MSEMSTRSVLIPTGSTNTKPSIDRPVKSISRVCAGCRPTRDVGEVRVDEIACSR